MEEKALYPSASSESDDTKKKKRRRISGSRLAIHDMTQEISQRDITEADPLAKARKRGGPACLEKYGKEHYRVLGQKGGTTTKQHQDVEYYRRIGALGREARRKKKLERQAHLVAPSSTFTEGNP